MREAVDDELQNIVGWSGAAQASDSMAPKDFLRRVQRERLQLERQSGGASAQKMLWSTWITGNPGTGKTRFAQLMSRYLRAYGMSDRDLYVECTASDLRGGNVVDAVKQVFAQAAGGVLFIDEAHDMNQADADTGAVDGSMQKLQSALLQQMDDWEGRITVVLAGYKDLMTKLMGSSKALENKFPFHIHIDDYKTNELVQIMQQCASASGFSFEDGLPAQLEKHLDESQDRSSFNVRSAQAFLQRAIQDNRDRLFKAGNGDGAVSTNTLCAADFHIGGKLGTDEDNKSALDREVEDLIGMRDAKEW